MALASPRASVSADTTASAPHSYHSPGTQRASFSCDLFWGAQILGLAPHPVKAASAETQAPDPGLVLSLYSASVVTEALFPLVSPPFKSKRGDKSRLETALNEKERTEGGTH